VSACPEVKIFAAQWRKASTSGVNGISHRYRFEWAVVSPLWGFCFGAMRVG